MIDEKSDTADQLKQIKLQQEAIRKILGMLEAKDTDNKALWALLKKHFGAMFKDMNLIIKRSLKP